ncbi:MAG: SgcJ/EcaC family oxidoreductase [Methylocella sp.]
MPDDERAIRELVQTWLAASQKGDFQTVLGLMADDVIFMVPGQKPFGKEAFAASSKALKDVRFEGSSDIKEIEVLGDWAYLRNYLEVTMTPPGGGAPLRRSGYTLTILRKEPDGRWLLVRDANLLAPQA